MRSFSWFCFFVLENPWVDNYITNLRPLKTALFTSNFSLWTYWSLGFYFYWREFPVSSHWNSNIVLIWTINGLFLIFRIVNVLVWFVGHIVELLQKVIMCFLFWSCQSDCGSALMPFSQQLAALCLFLKIIKWFWFFKWLLIINYNIYSIFFIFSFKH